MKTYSAKPTDVTRKWYVIDASEAPLGRIATKAATLLTGKDKPMFTHHIDCGDYVVIINADKTAVTGTKATDKMYYKHSGFPGRLTELSFDEVMAKNSTTPLFKAIRGMLPVNKLREDRLKRLKIYAGSEHNHAPQTPVSISVKKEVK